MKTLFEIISKDSKKTAVIASGDLSHKLLEKSPAGYFKQAMEFEQKLIDLLNKNQHDEILRLDKIIVKESADCGFRSILILLGILNGMNVKFNMLSYEYPFGTGYLTAEYDFL